VPATSTLMNVLYGLYQADEGQILIDDTPIAFKGPRDAMVGGSAAWSTSTYADTGLHCGRDVELGHEQTRRLGFLTHRPGQTSGGRGVARTACDVPPDALVADLPLACSNGSQIVKALIRNAQCSSLTSQPAVSPRGRPDDLMQVMQPCATPGTSIVSSPQAARGSRRRRPDHRDPSRGSGGGGVALRVLSRACIDDGGRPVRADGPTRASATPGEPVLQVESLRVVNQNGQVAVDGRQLLGPLRRESTPWPGSRAMSDRADGVPDRPQPTHTPDGFG